MRINKSLLAALAATLALGSCTDFINGFDAKSHEYKVNFEKQFGEIDPNQDWSMAAQTVANVNMPEIKGDAVISVFNGNPNASKSAKVLGRSVLKNGVGSFDFYSVKGINDVYVQIKQGKKVVYTNRYDIKNSAIMIGDFATRSFTDDNCPTTQGTDDNDVVEYTAFNSTPSLFPTGYKNSDGTGKTLAEWISWTLDKYVNEPWAYHNANNKTIFTDESLFIYERSYLDFSTAELKDNATNNGDGTITIDWGSYQQTFTIEDFKSWYTINNYSQDPGPWTNVTLITERCSKDDSGAEYKGFNTNSSEWVVNPDAEPYYANVWPTFQYLKNVEKDAAPAISMSKFYSVFGDGKFFAESVSVWDDSKLGVYYDKETMKKMEKGYSVVTTEGQVIELPYVFGCTAYSNQFGYIYYKAEDEDKIDPITLKHFVLIEDGRPASNIYRDGWGSAGTAVAGDDHNAANDWYYNYTIKDANGDDVTISYAGASLAKDNDVVCYCSADAQSGIYSSEGKHLESCYSPAERYAAVASKSFYGTTYRPMFFGEDYNASKGTYKWPAGYKIIFWINSLKMDTPESDDATNRLFNHTLENSNNGIRHFNYSIPTINKRLYHDYQGNITEGKDLTKFGQVQAISWTIDGATFLAFGDVSGDKDLNDMVFMISAPNSNPDNTVKVAAIKWHLNYNRAHDEADGDLFDQYSLNVGANYTNPKKNGANSEPSRPGYNFMGWSTDERAATGEKTISSTVANENTVCYFAIWEPIAPEPDPEPQSWIFACEDLGGSFDYDFNDVVWEVSQPSTESDGTVTYGDIQVRVLAAGGTLPIKLVYGSTVIGGEIHTTAFGQTADSDGKFAPVNVAKGDHPASYVLGTISAGGKKMDLTTLKANFKLIVSDAAGAGDFIVEARHGDANDKTPQILILPGGWRWPLEYKNIKSAYPKFTEWVGNSQNVRWTDNKVDDLLIDQY